MGLFDRFKSESASKQNEQTSTEWGEKADKFLHEGRYADAVKCVDEGLKIDSRNPDYGISKALR
jgi:hypothetical protein